MKRTLIPLLTASLFLTACGVEEAGNQQAITNEVVKTTEEKESTAKESVIRLSEEERKLAQEERERQAKEERERAQEELLTIPQQIVEIANSDEKPVVKSLYNLKNGIMKDFIPTKEDEEKAIEVLKIYNNNRNIFNQNDADVLFVIANTIVVERFYEFNEPATENEEQREDFASEIYWAINSYFMDREAYGTYNIESSYNEFDSLSENL